MCDQSNTNRSQARFQIIPDIDRMIEFVLSDRNGLSRKISPVDGELVFATISGCRSAKAFGLHEGELVIVDLGSPGATGASEDVGSWVFHAPIRAIVARGVAL